MNHVLGLKPGQIANIIDGFLEFTAESGSQAGQLNAGLDHFRRHKIMGLDCRRGSGLVNGKFEVDRPRLPGDIPRMNFLNEGQGFPVSQHGSLQCLFTEADRDVAHFKCSPQVFAFHPVAQRLVQSGITLRYFPGSQGIHRVIDFFGAVQCDHGKPEVQRHLDFFRLLQMIAVGAEPVLKSFLQHCPGSRVQHIFVSSLRQVQFPDRLLRQDRPQASPPDAAQMSRRGQSQAVSQSQAEAAAAEGDRLHEGNVSPHDLGISVGKLSRFERYFPNISDFFRFQLIKQFVFRSFKHDQTLSRIGPRQKNGVLWRQQQRSLINFAVGRHRSKLIGNQSRCK